MSQTTDTDQRIEELSRHLPAWNDARKDYCQTCGYQHGSELSCDDLQAAQAIANDRARAFWRSIPSDSIYPPTSIHTGD